MRLSRSPVTAALLAIIALVFGFELLTGAVSNGFILSSLGGIVPGTLQRHEYWRLVAAMFLHVGFLHWLVNSWALYQLGALYEELFGSFRFAITYAAAGLIASTASAMNARGVSVGASGAIFGVLGALIISIKRSPVWRHQPWTKSLLSQLVFWAVVNLVLGFSVQFIDNNAHIAGLVTGLLAGFIPHRAPPPPPGSAVIDVMPYEESPPNPEERRDER